MEVIQQNTDKTTSIFKEVNNNDKGLFVDSTNKKRKIIDPDEEKFKLSELKLMDFIRITPMEDYMTKDCNKADEILLKYEKQEKEIKSKELEVNKAKAVLSLIKKNELNPMLTTLFDNKKNIEKNKEILYKKFDNNTDGLDYTFTIMDGFIHQHEESIRKVKSKY
jgi:hypothetical protein